MAPFLTNIEIDNCLNAKRRYIYRIHNSGVFISYQQPDKLSETKLKYLVFEC